jgi:hypothetical protein
MADGFFGGIHAAYCATRGYVEIRHDGAVPGTRIKGVDKSVDGQKDARPRTLPTPTAFPHTHRRNSKFAIDSVLVI